MSNNAYILVELHRKAFFADAMVEGSGNFRKRVEKEGIPIYFPKD